MKKEQIERCLKLLNDQLAVTKSKGEICLYGGSVMCLIFNTGQGTKDVDAIFEPTAKIRETAKLVAETNRLPKDWLNDAAKFFLTIQKKEILYRWPNLKVYYCDPTYLLAMKAMSARLESADKKDIQFLLKALKVKSPEDVFAIVERYYPRKMIRPATQFFIEELFGK